MLYAKITPPAILTQQISPFEHQTIEADYMTVLARPYGAGATEINFEVLYGTITFNEELVPVSFQRIFSSSTTLTDTDLASWGTDDTVVLETVAQKIGTTTTEFVTIEGNSF